MKIQPIILLFLAISLSYIADYSFLIIPAVSSSNSLPLSSVSVIGLSAPDPPVVKNFPNNITIGGNLNLTGSSVVNLVGLSSSTPVKVFLNGSIFINDNATLILKHVALTFIGAKKSYSRNITLSSSNGHPQLNIVDASINGATTLVQVGRRTESRSYGVAIYAYNESNIIATGLSLTSNATKIECYGESSVFINSVNVKSIFTYGEANVTVYGGTVATSLGLYNSSMVSLYGVSFPKTVVADDAHLVLAHSTELGSSILTSKGNSRVDIINGTRLTTTLGVSSGVITTLPGVNATGNSKVYFLSSSTISATLYSGTVFSVYDNATLVVQNGRITKGAVLALDNSSVVFNNTMTGGSLQNIEIIGHDSSSVSISSCLFTGASQPNAINLFDSSRLLIFNSSIIAGYFVFSDNSAAYLSDTVTKSPSRIIAQDNVNLTVVGGSSIEDSIEMRDNSKLSLDSSAASLIYCPDSSQASFVNGSVTELSASDNSTVYLMNSTVQELSLTASNVTGSITGLTHFLENLTLSLPGSISHMSVLNTAVNGMDFLFSGNSDVTISNSTLRNLSLQGSSIVTLKNASVYAGLYVVGNSTVSVYSPLRVRCVDYFGNPLNGSAVTVAIGSRGTGSVQGKTDNSGWASFVFFSGIVNVTGSFPLGFVTVSGSFGGVLASKTISAALVGEEVTLSLPLPWWSGYILPVIVLVGIVALLALINYAYKRVRARS